MILRAIRFIMLMLLLIPQLNAAEKSKITSDIKTTAPETELSAEEKRSVSLAGGRILKHVHQARLASITGNKDEAKKNIEKALKLIDILEEAAPIYLIQTKIEAGGHVYEEKDEIQPLYVTVFDQLDHVMVLSPILEAQRTLSAGANRAYLGYTRAYFDVSSAQIYLEAAMKALDAGDFKLANESLLSIQLNVVFEFESMDLPLSRSSQNLLLSKNLLEQNQLQEAKQAFQTTIEALHQYEKNANPETVDKVQKVRSEMVSYLPQFENNPKASAQHITAWWDQVVTWFA